MLENIQLVFEDEHLLVIQKPFGVLSQKDRDGSEGVYEYLLNYLKPSKFLALHQRLDRVSGGLMLLSKTEKAAKQIQKMLEEKTITKNYCALVEGTPPQDEELLTHYVKKITNSNRMRAFTSEQKNSKIALLKYKKLCTFSQRSLLQLYPITGRLHQIRIQTAALACPVVGDKKYGKTSFLPDKHIALLSHQLRFAHPINESEMHFIATWPTKALWQDFEEFKPIRILS